MSGNAAEVRFHPGTIGEAAGIATASAQQVAEIAQELAGTVPAALRGLGGWHAAAALQVAAVAVADHARRLVDHSQAQVDELTAAVDSLLETDATVGGRYAAAVQR